MTTFTLNQNMDAGGTTFAALSDSLLTLPRSYTEPARVQHKPLESLGTHMSYTFRRFFSSKHSA